MSFHNQDREAPSRPVPKGRQRFRDLGTVHLGGLSSSGERSDIAKLTFRDGIGVENFSASRITCRAHA